MATVETLLTAEEFASLEDGQLSELVRGRVVPVNVPAFRHGYYCVKIARIIGNYVDEQKLGRVLSNDSGVITERNPDTVRGADVAFYSYARIPKGPLPEGYPPLSPELVFEVRSPGDTMGEILEKVGEYLQADVLTVCVLDSEAQTITLYTPNRGPLELNLDDELSFPSILPGFLVAVSRFFED